jgi:clan AA aspartic protease
MILGQCRDYFPRVTITLPAKTGSLPVEFIVDTGFDGHLSLPSRLLAQLDAEPLFVTVRQLADGSFCESTVYRLVLELHETFWTTEVLALEHNPLFGTTLMQGCYISIDMTEGGEVSIELQE